MNINFTGRNFPSEIILQSTRYYLSRDIEEILAERAINNGLLDNPKDLSVQEQFYALVAELYLKISARVIRLNFATKP